MSEMKGTTESGGTNAMFFLRSLEARVPNMLPFASRKCRDLCGCCHAHSNCRAALIRSENESERTLAMKLRRRLTSLEGNPCTIMCMTHGLLDRVFRAPWVSSPLCCLRCVRKRMHLEGRFATIPNPSRRRWCATNVNTGGVR